MCFQVVLPSSGGRAPSGPGRRWRIQEELAWSGVEAQLDPEGGATAVGTSGSRGGARDITWRADSYSWRRFLTGSEEKTASAPWSSW